MLHLLKSPLVGSCKTLHLLRQRSMKFITCQMKFKVFASGASMHLFAKGKASWRIWLESDREREKNSHTDRQAEMSFLSRHLYS
jgi:hypothetical protein